ncbi:MFS transporter [Sinorhizobium meliloti]|uniref:MFS transporter n=1 Tax=Rhizobium meliloti TaxID=382 RepID=UPI003F18BBB4
MYNKIDQNWPTLAATSVMFSLAMALPIYGGSVVNTFMSESLGWTKESLGAVFGVNMLSTAILNPLVVFALKRFGMKRTSQIGFAALAISGLLMTTVVTQVWQAVLCFSILSGMTITFSGILSCQSLLSSWFVKRRSLAIAIMYSVQGVAGFALVSLVTTSIVRTGSYKAGWLVFLIGGVVGFIFATVFMNRPGDVTPMSEAERLGEIAPPADGIPPAHEEMTLGQAYKTPLLWAIYLGMLTLIMAESFNVAHSQIQMRNLGVSDAFAAFAMSVILAASVAGNLLFGLFVQKISIKIVYAGSILLLCAGFFLISVADDRVTVMAFAIIVGLGFGACQVSAMAHLGHFWGDHLFPPLAATGLVIQVFGGASVGVMGGAYFDQHHTYLPVIYFICGANLITLAVYAVTASMHKQDALQTA